MARWTPTVNSVGTASHHDRGTTVQSGKPPHEVKCSIARRKGQPLCHHDTLFSLPWLIIPTRAAPLIHLQINLVLDKHDPLLLEQEGIVSRMGRFSVTATRATQQTRVGGKDRWRCCSVISLKCAPMTTLASVMSII